MPGPKLNLANPDAYRLSILKSVGHMLNKWCIRNKRDLSTLTMPEIKANLKEISKYPHMNLRDMRFTPENEEINYIKTDSLNHVKIENARNIYMEGKVFCEDTTSGEGTRLGLGNKFLLTPDILLKAVNIAHHKQMAPISLGIRHKLKYIQELSIMAQNDRLNPSSVLKSQWSLTTLNDDNADAIINDVLKYDHFGYDPDQMLFLIQQKYSGIDLTPDGVAWSKDSPKHLYNHGENVIASAMDKQIFRVRYDKIHGKINKEYLTADQFGEILKNAKVKISYPIEDIDYLNKAINLHNIYMALEYGEKGYDMVMEVTQQKENRMVKDLNLIIKKTELDRCLDQKQKLVDEYDGDMYIFRPGEIPAWASSELRKAWLDSITAIKCGFWAFDKIIEKGVMIESDHGNSVIDNDRRDTLTKVKMINRNFNIFPNPYNVWNQVRQNGLPMHVDVKDGYIYLTIPQGDQNLLVKTAFISEELPHAIRNLKSPEDIPHLIASINKQDATPGFLDLAREKGIIPLAHNRIMLGGVFIPILSLLEPKAIKKETPLSMDEFMITRFLETLDEYARDHLTAISGLCDVTGSYVRKYKILDDGRVELHSIAGTIKGTAKNYKSNAMTPVYASDSKELLAKKGNMINIRWQENMLLLDIPNKQTLSSGEIITLVIEPKQDKITKEQLDQYFSGKIKRTCEIVADMGITEKEARIKELYLRLPLIQLLLNKAHKIAELVLPQIQNGMKSRKEKDK